LLLNPYCWLRSLQACISEVAFREEREIPMKYHEWWSEAAGVKLKHVPAGGHGWERSFESYHPICRTPTASSTRRGQDAATGHQVSFSGTREA
jgi:hypothetical protein